MTTCKHCGTKNVYVGFLEVECLDKCQEPKPKSKPIDIDLILAPGGTITFTGLQGWLPQPATPVNMAPKDFEYIVKTCVAKGFITAKDAKDYYGVTV